MSVSAYRRGDAATVTERTVRTNGMLPRAESLAQLPVVALVGRPNTGKSTLFNRLTRSRRAVVASAPGVTRDRNMAVAEYDDRRFIVVDTGGFEADESADLGQAVRRQSLLAAEEADAVIVLVDGRAGTNPLDTAVVEQLRRLRAPLFVAVNKIDTAKQEDLASEFYALGVDVLYPISAEHGINVGALLDDVLAALPAAGPEPVEGAQPLAVAIIGRPNVGKSSLLNRLVGYDRAVVSPTPGTTRDAIDTTVTRRGSAYVLVDTAGVRRRPKVAALVERASVVRALRALERAEIALLVVDATEGMTEQDARLASYAWERGRAVVLVVNKWDVAPEEERDRVRWARRVDERFPSLTVVPKLFVSALTGLGTLRIWEAIDGAAAHHRARLATARVNHWLARAVEQQAPAMVHGKRPRFFYATQTAIAPPTITIFTSNPKYVHPSYERYLLNRLRAQFDLEGTPVRLRFRTRPRSERQGQPRVN